MICVETILWGIVSWTFGLLVGKGSVLQPVQFVRSEEFWRRSEADNYIGLMPLPSGAIPLFILLHDLI